MADVSTIEDDDDEWGTFEEVKITTANTEQLPISSSASSEPVSGAGDSWAAFQEEEKQVSIPVPKTDSLVEMLSKCRGLFWDENNTNPSEDAVSPFSAPTFSPLIVSNVSQGSDKQAKKVITSYFRRLLAGQQQGDDDSERLSDDDALDTPSDRSSPVPPPLPSLPSSTDTAGTKSSDLKSLTEDAFTPEVGESHDGTHDGDESPQQLLVTGTQIEAVNSGDYNNVTLKETDTEAESLSEEEESWATTVEPEQASSGGGG